MPSTPTSAIAASAPGSTAAWCRCARSSRTATSSRSSPIPAHKPSRDWLSFVRTARARSKIRQLIQTEEKNRAVDVGRKLLEKEARRFDLTKVMVDGDPMKKAAETFGLTKPDDLLAQIGYGKVSARQVIDALVPSGELKEKAPDHPVVSAVKRVLRPGGTADRITVSGADDLMVVRARCCNPIRGERIVGYITRGKGVSVHSATCSNVVNLLYDPERRIDVEWDSGGDAAPYTVRLTMQVEDRKGMLAQLSASIADINTNILSLEATTGADAHARIDVTVEIKDVKHLEKVIKSLRKVDGVLDVERATTADRAQPDEGDGVDFDADVARQAGHLHGGAGGVRRREAGGVDLVHRREVAHVGQVDRRLDDAREVGPGGGQQAAHVLEHLDGLLADAALDDDAGGVQRDLARQEQELAGAQRRRVGADRRSPGRRGHGLAHAAARAWAVGHRVRRP